MTDGKQGGSDGSLIALVTGANRGIGFEVCRQLARQGMTVLLCARDAAAGESAAKTLVGEGLDVLPRRVDVTSTESIDDVRRDVEARFGKLDVLVNNAGGHYDPDQRTTSADLETIRDALETNLFGAWRMVQAFLPLLRKSSHGRIVNVSSEAASFASTHGLANMGYDGVSGGESPAYSISKTALNAFTAKLAAELKGTGILVNAVCPGYTATHPDAAGGRPVEEGAASVVWAATLPDSGPSGGFFRDGQTLSW
jgi:NAD(P)-dependent dehydrogenase (short-subunit alcohol dehydrogenase family)